MILQNNFDSFYKLCHSQKFKIRLEKEVGREKIVLLSMIS